MTKNEQIEDASRTKVNTAFLIEALVLMAVLIASMAVFTQLFTHSAVAAHQAEELTRATLLAQNAAEEFSSDPQPSPPARRSARASPPGTHPPSTVPTA